MAIVIWPSSICRASRASGSSAGEHTVARKGTLTLAAVVLAASIASLAVTGCSREDERVASTRAADAAPMLPGTRGSSAGAAGAGAFSVEANTDQRSDTGAQAGAQRFDTTGSSSEPGTPGALLPPVMHSAD